MFLAFVRKWRVPLSANYTNTQLGHHLVLLTMHKTRLDIVTFTYEEKVASARWILDNGFTLPSHVYIAGGKLHGVECADVIVPNA
jgi:hypothetical protein